MKEEEHAGDGDSMASHSFAAYYHLLRSQKAFRVLWLGEVINNLGAWLNFVATVSVVERLAPGRSTLVSLALVVKLAPNAVLFALTGVVADRCDKAFVLLAVNLLAATFVSLCAVVRSPPWLWLLYVLTLGQAAMGAFYDPAKRALTPGLVAAGELPLATTLDAVAWSAIGAFGSALGGFAVSRLGTAACFLLDGGTYLFAAYQAAQLMAILPMSTRVGDTKLEEGEAGEGSAKVGAAGGIAIAAKTGAAVAESEAARRRSEGGASGPSGDEETQALLAAGPSPASPPGAPPLHSSPGSPAATPSGLRRGTLWRDLGRELRAVADGWHYTWSPGNRDLAVFVFLKGSGGLLWGACDILNVQFSDQPTMQSLGDAPTTLGLLFSAVALGCFVGPLVYNRITPNRLPAFLAASASTFWLLLGGYVLMGLAGSIWALFPSVVVRSCGSAVLWTYSSLILQVRAEERFLGRVLALEMALYTVLFSSSVVFAGFATQTLGLSTRGLIAVMCLVTVCVSSAWTWYARSPKSPGGSSSSSSSSGSGSGSGSGSPPARVKTGPGGEQPPPLEILDRIGVGRYGQDEAV